MWWVTPLSSIQNLNEEINLLPIFVVMLEEIIDTWLEILRLNFGYCKRANKAWRCLGVKPICWACSFDFEPSWFYSPSLSESAL